MFRSSIVYPRALAGSIIEHSTRGNRVRIKCYFGAGPDSLDPGGRNYDLVLRIDEVVPVTTHRLVARDHLFNKLGDSLEDVNLMLEHSKAR